jgi:hypothetical protein
VTDDELLAFYRDRYPDIDVETAWACYHLRLHYGSPLTRRPGGLADDLPPGNPCGPALAIASGYAKDRPRRRADGR